MLETAPFPRRYADPRPLAHGGMGDVFVARDAQLGRHVAIKVLAERFGADRDLRRRFVQEALAAARLSGHPHIVTIYDVGEDGGLPYIVMEHLGGGTLAERLRERRPTPRQALGWLEQAAQAIDAAHEHGVVHRDIKPGNLVFDERGSLHVADFGIARVMDEALPETTAAGLVLGTAGYLSPEQARGEPATAASDVYALGVVAFELLTGRRPFARESPAAETFAHASEPPPAATSLEPSLPPAVDAVFERALAKEPAVRYPDAHTLVAALREALDPAAATAVMAVPAAQPARYVRSRRRRAWPVAALLALVALAAGVAAAVLLGSGESAATGVRTVTHVVTSNGQPTVVTHVVKRHESAAAPSPSPSPATAPAPSPAGPHALNDRAWALMKQGRYADALPLLRQAVAGLRGVGPADPYEAYADYNLGDTLLQLGRCSQALPYLQRAASLEDRSEVTAAIAQAQACATGGAGDGGGHGKHKAKGHRKHG